MFKRLFLFLLPAILLRLQGLSIPESFKTLTTGTLDLVRDLLQVAPGQLPAYWEVRRLSVATMVLDYLVQFLLERKNGNPSDNDRFERRLTNIIDQQIIKPRHPRNDAKTAS